jgi:hypothetical protein
VTTQSAWRGEYYANPDLHGNPTLVRDDAAIGFDWGNEAPAPGLPADAFSVRWTGVASFAQGPYLFHATIDDGMRVYVDDELLIDEWRDRPEREVTVRRQMAAGAHALRVEYYERGHRAVAKFWWEPERSFSGWKGHYWPNQGLEGNPRLVRDDPQVSFDWQMGSPGGGIPKDHFSARWTRTLHLQDGTYRFRLLMDDGARLWVDDLLIIDEWRDHASREVRADHVVAGTGAHTIMVEYYDNTFEARIHLDWERLGDPVYTHWKGEYFDNVDLAGAPVLARNDRSLDFNWGLGAPAPSLPADSFSVRWTRDKEFDPGRYRLLFQADDGFRFWVDDELVLDEWHSAREDTYQVEMDLPWKPRLKVEFYEDSGDAKIQFWWEKI